MLFTQCGSHVCSLLLEPARNRQALPARLEWDSANLGRPLFSTSVVAVVVFVPMNASNTQKVNCVVLFMVSFALILSRIVFARCTFSFTEQT